MSERKLFQAVNSTADQIEGGHDIRRHQRIQWIEEDNATMREALEAIANHPKCQYDGIDPFKHAISQGVRNVAFIARQALLDIQKRQEGAHA